MTSLSVQLLMQAVELVHELRVQMLVVKADELMLADVSTFLELVADSCSSFVVDYRE